jgi:hypothetical protein
MSMNMSTGLGTGSNPPPGYDGALVRYLLDSVKQDVRSAVVIVAAYLLRRDCWWTIHKSFLNQMRDKSFRVSCRVGDTTHREASGCLFMAI